MDLLPEDVLFSICTSDEKGRHAVAKQTIPVGRCTLKADPYAAVLYSDQMAARCSQCMGVSSGPLLRCQTSKVLRFCSKDCQRHAWHHSSYREEMRALAAYSPRVPPPTCYLAAKIMWKRYRQSETGAKMTFWDTHDAVDCLESHWDILDDERKEAFAQMAMCARDFATKGLERPELEERLPELREVAKLVARLSSNCHTICDEELRPLGIGLYPLGAMINHSCKPNCVQFFGKCGRIDFQTAREVGSGEELTISYIDLANTLQERREALAYSYHFDILGSLFDLSGMKPGKMSHFRPRPSSQASFQIDSPNELEGRVKCTLLAYSGVKGFIPPWSHDEVDIYLSGVTSPDGLQLCGGVMCNVLNVETKTWEVGDNEEEGSSKKERETEIEVAGWGDWCGSPHKWKVAQDIAIASLLLARWNESSKNQSHSIRSLTEALDLVDKLLIPLHAHHLLRTRIKTSLLKALIDKGKDWGQALQLSRDLIPVFQMVYPSTHPNMILHLASLAKLEALVGDSSQAKELARCALSQWQTISPPRSSLLSDGQHVEEQLLDMTRDLEGSA